MSRESFVSKRLHCSLVNESENMRLPIAEFVLDEDDPAEKFAKAAFDFCKNNLKRLNCPSHYSIVVNEGGGKETAFGLDLWIKFKMPE